MAAPPDSTVVDSGIPGPVHFPLLVGLTLVGILIVMAPVVSAPVQAAEARIGDFKFECRTPDGKRLKPKFGDVDGGYFPDLPDQRAACLAAVDRKIAWCRENTVFTSSTKNREYAGCLPVFESQARDCAAFFRNERPKCSAGGTGAANSRDAWAAPDPWSDGESNRGGSVWDPPAPEAAAPGSRKQATDWPSPPPAAGDAGDADEDASSYAAALSEVLGEAPQAEGAQDDYTGALAALERAELEAKREAASRAEERELQKQREREAENHRRQRADEHRRRAERAAGKMRQAEYETARAARRANEESLRQWGNTFQELGNTLLRQRQAEEAARERRRQRERSSAPALEWEGGSRSTVPTRNCDIPGAVITC